MALPLYQALQDCQGLADLRKNQHAQGHAGLWFERFYDRYQPGFGKTKSNDNDFREWLADFQGKAGEAELLDAALQRQAALVNALAGDFAVFKSPWHFVSGMGYPHPLENGFNWHPVWGVPYLPGAGVKGLVRSWVEAWEYEDCEDKDRQDAKKAQLLDWFGSVDKKPESPVEAQTGKVIFFDAIPLRPVMLTTDIMTPHMGKWYAQGGDITDVSREPEKVPADWHSPEPVYFLSAKEPAFMVSVAPRDEVVAAEIDLDEVMRCVGCAFEWLGAGAKTAVGYGQFEYDEAWTQRRKAALLAQQESLALQQVQAQALSGLEGVTKALMQHSQQANWEGDKHAFLAQGEGNLESWLEQLADEPHPAAVSHLRMLFELHFAKPDLLSDPLAVTGKKNKPVFKARAQALAKRFLEIEALSEE